MPGPIKTTQKKNFSTPKTPIVNIAYKDTVYLKKCSMTKKAKK